jgi:tight adherence protein B
MPLSWGASEMYLQILFAAFGSTILFGVALIWALHAERRRAIIEPRLRAISAATSNVESVGVSLRRPRARHKALPTALLTWLDNTLAATGNRIRLPHLIATAIITCVMIGFAAAITLGRPVPSIALAGAAAAGVPTLLLRLLQNRNRRQFLDIFPDALDLIVRAVRVPIIEAIELAAREIRTPVGTELERVLGEIRIGVEIEDALQHAADRIRVPDFRFFVVSLLLHRDTGGSIAEILSNLSAVIRQRKALRMKARALTAEATSSAAVVATMPFLAGLGLFLINREIMSVMFVDPRGRFMLGVAGVSLLLDVVVMKAMIKKASAKQCSQDSTLARWSISSRCISLLASVDYILDHSTPAFYSLR